MKKKICCKNLFFSFYSIICLLLVFFSNTTAHAKESISYNTIITKENIDRAMEYLGLDKDSLEADETLAGNSYTIGEIYALIQQADNKNAIKTDVFSENSIMRATGTKNLSHISYMDSYHVIIKVAAKYNGKKWISAGAPKASISQQTPGTISKIGSNNLISKCYSSKVVLSGSVTVNTYIGLGNVGLLKINSNKISYTNVVWKASSYL